MKKNLAKSSPEAMSLTKVNVILSFQARPEGRLAGSTRPPEIPLLCLLNAVPVRGDEFWINNPDDFAEGVVFRTLHWIGIGDETTCEVHVRFSCDTNQEAWEAAEYWVATFVDSDRAIMDRECAGKWISEHFGRPMKTKADYAADAD